MSLTERPSRILAAAGELVAADLDREALDTLAPLLSEQPDHLEALLLAAQARLGLDDPIRASRLLSLPFATHPDDPTVVALLSWAEFGQGHRDRGIELCRRRCQLAPHDWTGFADLATQLTVHRGSEPEALRAARMAVSLAPLEAGAHARLGWVLLCREENRAAARSYRRALGISPGHEAARHGLGIATAGRGHFIEATQSLAKLAAERPGDPGIERHIVTAVAWPIWIAGAGCLLVTLAAFAADLDRLGPDSAALREQLPLVAATFTAVAGVVTAVRLRRILPGIANLIVRRRRRLLVRIALILLAVALLLTGGFLAGNAAVFATFGAAIALIFGGTASSYGLN